MPKSHASIRAQHQIHFSLDSHQKPAPPISEHFTFFVSLLQLLAQILCSSHVEILFPKHIRPFSTSLLLLTLFHLPEMLIPNLPLFITPCLGSFFSPLVRADPPGALLWYPPHWNLCVLSASAAKNTSTVFPFQQASKHTQIYPM